MEDTVFNVRWIHTGDDDSWSVLQGHQVGGVYKKLDDQYMLKAHGHNQFGPQKIEIPNGATFEGLSDHQVLYFCRNPVPDPHLDGVELSDWKEYVRDKCLTIRDVKNLQQGETIKVVHMDRNLWDVVCDSNNSDQLYDPKEFFEDVTAEYTHDSEMKGRIHWSFGDEREFEFEIEYKEGHWYPLEDGRLPENDPQGFSNFGDASGKHYDDFPKGTLIGWRGPMILQDKLDDLDQVYWHDDTANE